MRLLATMFIFLMSTLAFAEEAVRVDPDILPPLWILDLVMWLNEVPVVGPYLKLFFEWTAALATISTLIAAAAIGSLKASSKILPKLGLDAKAKELEVKSEKIIYWLKYVSLFNATKKTRTAGDIIAEKK